MSDNDVTMRIKDVAAFLRMAESTVYKLANEGKLPGRKFGGGWRFSRRELERWLSRPEMVGEGQERGDETHPHI